jgi:hypothetical protein
MSFLKYIDYMKSEEVDAIVNKLSDWRGERLSQIRNLIWEADPEVIEEAKWKKATNPDGVPVWSDNGMICTGEFYKDHLRLTFKKAGEIEDPKGFFNAHSAIIINENDKVDEAAFKDLIRAVVKLNRGE